MQERPQLELTAFLDSPVLRHNLTLSLKHASATIEHNEALKRLQATTLVNPCTGACRQTSHNVCLKASLVCLLCLSLQLKPLRPFRSCTA